MAEIKISFFVFGKETDFPKEIGGVPTVMVSWLPEDQGFEDIDELPTGGWYMLYAKRDGRWVKEWEIDTTPNGWGEWNAVTICVDGGDIYGYGGVCDADELMQEVCERLWTETNVSRNGKYIWVDINLQERGCFPGEED